jgi:hypothetical protein
MFLSHWSDFYASRATIRNFILNLVDPPYAKAMNRLGAVPPVYPSEQEIIAESRVRLHALRELCLRNGVDLVFLVPPALDAREEPEEPILRAGALERVDIDIPIHVGVLGPEFYMDRFHLNPKGALVFTDALARDLDQRLRIMQARSMQ